ncbi:MAG: response regulator [Gemmatimonadaceae bacterium]
MAREGSLSRDRHLPDVVLSDVMMPGTDGRELVRVLRGSDQTDFRSIILLMAQAEDEQRLEGLERGVRRLHLEAVRDARARRARAQPDRIARAASPRDRRH